MMKGKGKGGKNKSSKLRRQEAQRYKKSNLSHGELKNNLLSIISNLENLVFGCSEKTELGSFLSSVSSSFYFEEVEVRYEDLNPADQITIEDVLDALWYDEDLRKSELDIFHSVRPNVGECVARHINYLMKKGCTPRLELYW